MTDTVAPEAPSLGLQDIENTLKIIDYASEQGAFKGWNTIQQVLAVRTKVAAFVEYATAQTAAEAASVEDANKATV